MSEFTTDKSITITHYDDGFRFVVYTEDDPAIISIAYQQRRGEKQEYETIDCIHGLWKESGKMLAHAILELVDIIDGDR